jgi:hypothetical protein
MITIVDRPKLKNRAALSNLASTGGLVLLLASVVVPLFLPKWAKFSFVVMAFGLGTAMVGIYFANRWVRRPRPEDSLDQALKPLSDSHHLFHYPALPCDHVLLTPNGVVLLETVNLSGEFYYQNQRWKETMSMGRAIRFIVEEHLGDPIRSIRQTENDLKERFHQELGPDFSVPIKPIVVFIPPGARLELEGPPIPVCKVDKLRKQISIQGPKLEPEVYDRLDEFFRSATLGK